MTVSVANLTELREKVVLACRMIGSRGVSKGSFGHVSARIPGTASVLIKSKGPDEEALEFTTGRDVITLALDGQVLEAPAGLVRVRATCRDGKVTEVTFRNVPAFAVHLDKEIDVPTLGRVTVDVAWGGMFYVIADAAPFGLRLTPDEGRDITRIGELIKAATREQLPVVHPDNPEIKDVTIAQLSGPAASPQNDRRNAVIVSTGTLDWKRPSTWTGAIDRSPCGTGTCAKMATLHARGQLALHQPFRHEGVLGTVFTGTLLEESTVGPYRAVVPQLAGAAWITGFARYVVDPTDPFPDGFTVGDIW